ncbi:hypothetical protein D3C87_2074960 [compost metagenome]
MPHHFFEFAQLLTHRRLRSMHTLGGAGEAAFIHYANEGFEQFEIEHGDSLDI